MKKVLLILFIAPVFSFSCTATKPVINNSSLFDTHLRPYKVFSIGNWQPGYSVITLTDARNDYFTIKVLSNDSLKIGDIYQTKF